jgi:hypothetical protein
MSASITAGQKVNLIDCRALAAELVSRQVTVIAADGGPQSARAARPHLRREGPVTSLRHELSATPLIQ